MWAILADSTTETIGAMKFVTEINRETPFGRASHGARQLKTGNTTISFIPRLGPKGEWIPSEVNTRANIYSLKREGVKFIIALSSVNSLKAEFPPGQALLVDQYFDRTKGLRAQTFFGQGVSGQISLAEPTCRAYQQLIAMKADWSFPLYGAGTYVGIEGPSYPTRVESLEYRKLDGDVVGMTGWPEAALAREAGMCYIPICFVTEFDAWNDGVAPLTVEQRLQMQRENDVKASEIIHYILETAAQVSLECSCTEGGISHHLSSPQESSPPQARIWLQTFGIKK